jgi:hypothetical protein
MYILEIISCYKSVVTPRCTYLIRQVLDHSCNLYKILVLDGHIQVVIESCTDILTTSYWFHVELGKKYLKNSVKK